VKWIKKLFSLRRHYTPVDGEHVEVENKWDTIQHLAQEARQHAEMADQLEFKAKNMRHQS
jgi:hypothetical protein